MVQGGMIVMSSTEITRIDQTHAALPATPEKIHPLQLYAALLADARKPPTRRAREQDIADLTAFLKARETIAAEADPSAVCAKVIAGGPGWCNAMATAYTEHMLDRGLSPATINRRVSTIRRLVKLGRRYDLIEWLIDVDRIPAKPYRDTRGPGSEGMKALINEAKARATTPKGKRDWAILALFYTAGLRRAELAGLDLADLDLDNHRVQVLGKGRHETEWLPMGATAARAIGEWLEVRGGEPGPLFVRLDSARTGADRLTDDGIHHVVQTMGRRAGVTRPVAPHKIRHASITRASERTKGDIPKVQQFSRHVKTETVALYVDAQRAVAAELAELLDQDL